MKSLIIGMGIGGLYKSVYTTLNHTVVTVDNNPDVGADFTSVEDALKIYKKFDTVNICTPNFTHKLLTEMVAPYSDIIFVEKPGFRNSEEWNTVINKYPDTRIMMIKNNMWRDNINDIKEYVSQSDSVHINWIRRNCIPNPGSWFTNKELSFGGVSKDLMPHLLSLYIALNPEWKNTNRQNFSANQHWTLDKITSTEYGKGIINYNGIYNVDDECLIDFGDKWKLNANWRSLTSDDSGISFYSDDNLVKKFDLGWCPEEAYLNMISDAIANKDNEEFWQEQFEQDIWIHKQIEEL